MRDASHAPRASGSAADEAPWEDTSRPLSERPPGIWNDHPVVRVLMVEDSVGDARLIREILNRDSFAAFELKHAGRLDEALRHLAMESFDAVLLDLGLPDASGREALDSILETVRDTAIIVLTGRREGALASEAVQRGAQDYLVKGQECGRSLSKSIRYAVGRTQAKQSIERLAFHDALTGLPNRRLFRYALGRAVAKARRASTGIALFFLDLDNLKSVNDAYGHQAGDELLKATALRLEEVTRESDTVARVGGDEFALVCPDTAGRQGAIVLARKILGALQAPVVINGRRLPATASIGVALYPDDGGEPEELLSHADRYMYEAKNRGGNGIHMGVPARTVPRPARFDPGPALARALNRGDLELHYQPQVDLRTGTVVALEALARWKVPRRGWVPPTEFIRVAEDTGLIDALGERVLRTACMQARAWEEAASILPRIAVNISVLQLRRADLKEKVKRILDETALDPRRLELELTEGVGYEERNSVRALRRLKSLGIRLALDDFGRGAAGFSALKLCPLDTIKIDQLFVRGIGANPPDEGLVAAIIELAHGLGLSVTAEGVESAVQMEFLQKHGCDQAQGHFFSPPLKAEEVGLHLSERKERWWSRKGSGRAGVAGWDLSLVKASSLRNTGGRNHDLRRRQPRAAGHSPR